MKSKQQKRDEAIQRAEDRYQEISKSTDPHWKWFLLRYPTMNSYADLFKPKQTNNFVSTPLSI